MDPADNEIYDFGLFLLNKILQQSGKQLDDFPPMPVAQYNWDSHIKNHYINEQLNYDCTEEHNKFLDQVVLLNQEQRDAYEQIMASIENQQGHLFFLNGQGGTGKTYVYNTLCYKICSEGWIVLCVASSGITALLLQGGCTVHSMFKIPVEGLTDKSFCSIPKESLLAKMICQTRLIILDEATMQHQFTFEAVD